MAIIFIAAVDNANTAATVASDNVLPVLALGTMIATSMGWCMLLLLLTLTLDDVGRMSLGLVVYTVVVLATANNTSG